MPRATLFWSFAAVAIAAAVWQAWALRWTCDDAFVSFRYAQHFAAGHGLVFNLDPAEPPVEGYTNFSWTMWLALGVLLGCTDAALEQWSIAWGILAHAATVALLAETAFRASGGRAVAPVAACGYAAVHHGASLAPAGLETALFTLLVLALLRGVLWLRCARRAWLLGFLGVLTAITRPDGAIPVAAAGAFVAAASWRRRHPALLRAYAAPFALVFVPYLLWRRTYYGHWVPNTFFAKSGSEPYASQGWIYVRDFLGCYWALLPGIAVAGWFLLRRPDPLAPVDPVLGRRPWLLIAAFVLPYLGFVVWVGGDFMFGRFLLPVVPVMLLSWDFAAARSRRPRRAAALAVLLPLGLAARIEPDGLDNPLNPVSDNRTITMRDYVPGVSYADALRICGDYLRELFAGLDVRLAIAGGHANLAYRSRVPVAIECAAGLTDAHIARLPVSRRGKVAHDKPRDPLYLEQRGVHFMLELNYFPDDRWRDIMFTPVGLPMRLVTWDRELMRELRRREPSLAFEDFEHVLDAHLAALPTMPAAQLQADFALFRRFYFDHNDDPDRLAAFQHWLR